jgi:hypothetical protein
MLNNKSILTSDIDPEKMLAYLKDRANRLESEMVVLRTELCQKVIAGDILGADEAMDKILWKTAAQMATLDEYLHGQVYADTLKTLQQQET